MEDTFKSLILSEDLQEAVSLFVIEQLRKHCSSLDERNKTIEIKILTDYYIQLFTYGRDNLHLTRTKLIQLLVIAHSIIHYDYFDISHSIHSDSDLLTQLKLDFDTMKSLLLNSRLSKHEIIAVSEYLGNSYFKHYRLYNYIFTSKQTVQTKYISLTIDQPITTFPLSQAVQRLKIRNNQKTDFMIKEDLARVSSRKPSLSPSHRNLSKNPSSNRFPGEISAQPRDFPHETPKPLLTQEDKLENSISLSKMKFKLKLENKHKELMEKITSARK